MSSVLNFRLNGFVPGSLNIASACLNYHGISSSLLLTAWEGRAREGETEVTMIQKTKTNLTKTSASQVA